MTSAITRLQTLLMATLALSPQIGTAQALPSRAVLLGTIVDESGGPIRGVAVYVLGHDGQARTGDLGQFELPGLAPGTHRLVARCPGYAPDTTEFGIATRDTAAIWIVMRRSVTALPAFDVHEVSIPARLADFEARKLHAIGGHFIGPADIEKQAPTETSDLLRRVLGVRIADSSHVMVPVSNRGNKVVNIGKNLVSVPCVMRIGKNGFIQDPSFTLNLTSPNDIYGIEVYNGPASIPPQYNGNSTDNYCGLIMIWTKSG